MQMVYISSMYHNQIFDQREEPQHKPHIMEDLLDLTFLWNYALKLDVYW